MTNKHIRKIQTTLFINKLNALLKDLHKKWQDGSLATQQDVIEEFNGQLNDFFKNLRDPNFTPIKAITGLLPSFEDYNTTFETIGQDLEVIFKELKTAEDVVIGNFNYVVTERDRLNKEIKSISSKLGDYILFTDDALGKTLYFKDSFNDVSKIDIGSNRLNSIQAEIKQAEGIVTLSINRDTPAIKKIEEVVINSNSNGQAGNNSEIGTTLHNDIAKILDSNPDSWFEYERVQRTIAENTDPLKLDLTLRLSKEEVINFIRINPNNFGTQNWLKIDEIETSLDGNVFISIKDDIPISGFLAEDEENIFELAPSVSKFAGEGLYTFIPRKARYVHVILLQTTPYPIETPSGIQQRFAVGIRDIEVQALPYVTDSELVSLPIIAPEEIKKVALLASENPLEHSELADITHQISPDDGNTWYDIQPQDRTGTEAPEILNFNTTDLDAIITPTPVTELRHKIILSRDSAAFKAGASTLRQTVKDTVELVNLPSISPFKVGIENAPVDGSVALLNPLFGSRGKEDPKLLLGVSNGDEVIFTIPIEPRGDIYNKTNFRNMVRVYVDNIQWYRVGSFDDDDPQTGETIDLSSKVFIINNQNQIIFGDGVKGKVPIAGSVIGITVETEPVFPTQDSPHTAPLQFDSDGNKENTIVRRVDPNKTITNEPLTKNAQVFQIKNKFLDLESIRIIEKDPSGTTIADTNSSGSTGLGTFRYKTTFRKEFVDGHSELETDGEWSVDVEKGILYSYILSSSTNTISITYSYTPKRTISSDDWDFIIDPSDNIRRGIEIKSSAYTTNSAEESIPTGVRVIQLGHIGIVPKSLTLPFDEALNTGVFGAGVVPIEIPFVDGIIELSNVVQVKEEEIIIPVPGSPPIDYLYTYTLQNASNLELSFSPIFTNTTIFATEVTGTPTANGQYKITSGVVTVYINPYSGSIDLGYVSYYFKDTALDAKLPGKYSIDHKRGTIYCFSTTVATTDSVQYQFTNYEIDYNIAKPLDKKFFNVNAPAKEISISDTEIIRAYNSISVVNKTRQIVKIMYKYVETTRDSIEELEPYFSPIVKDYVLKILTKSRL